MWHLINQQPPESSKPHKSAFLVRHTSFMHIVAHIYGFLIKSQKKNNITHSKIIIRFWSNVLHRKALTWQQGSLSQSRLSLPWGWLLTTPWWRLLTIPWWRLLPVPWWRRKLKAPGWWGPLSLSWPLPWWWHLITCSVCVRVLTLEASSFSKSLKLLSPGLGYWNCKIK